jgi:hypothetical protein
MISESVPNILWSSIGTRINTILNGENFQRTATVQLNQKNQKKNNQKNRTKKKLIKPIKFLKKPAGSVRFRFYKQKTKKTEPNQNRQKTGKKPSQNRKKLSQNRENRAKTGKTEPNRFEPVFALKNQTEPNQNRSVCPGFGFFFKKIIILV